MTCIIAITGGIGSGKSAVCRCLESLGLQVYDCDSRAKALMDADHEIHRQLAAEISPDVIDRGCIDRRRLASVVFSDSDKLNALNSIVHGSVRNDIAAWIADNASDAALFIETAILLESELHRMVDRVWVVTASDEVRLQRACRRDNANPDAIRARMASQRSVTAADIDVPLYEIDNNGHTALLPRILELISDLTAPDTLRRWKS